MYHRRSSHFDYEGFIYTEDFIKAKKSIKRSRRSKTLWAFETLGFWGGMFYDDAEGFALTKGFIHT